MQHIITNRIEDIAQTLVKKNAGFFDRLGGNFIIAGGVFKFLKFSKESDVDIFPVTGNWDIGTIKSGIDVLNSSKNATTFSYFGLTFQLCNYRKESLADLIDSFDFNYCQCGVEYKDNKLVNVNYSDAFIEWVVCKEVKYTGSEYPLSSMIRLAKLYKKDMMNAKEYRRELMNVLYDVVKRGFKDRDDLKNQLDAIDLMDKDCGQAYKLLEVLKKDDAE